jgi:hypothetical protein
MRSAPAPCPLGRRRNFRRLDSSSSFSSTITSLLLARRKRAAVVAAAGAHGPSLFIFGMGYTGRELARQAAERGWRVCGTTTAAAEAEAQASPRLPPTSVQAVRFAPRRDGSDRAARAGGGAEALLW